MTTQAGAIAKKNAPTNRMRTPENGFMAGTFASSTPSGSLGLLGPSKQGFLAFITLAKPPRFPRVCDHFIEYGCEFDADTPGAGAARHRAQPGRPDRATRPDDRGDG